MNRINLYDLLIRVHVFLILFTVTGSIYVVATGNAEYLIGFITIPIINLLLIPITNKHQKFDPGHPIFLILVSVTIGTVLRSFFIVSPIQSDTKSIMMLGQPPSFLINGILCIYVAFISFVFGFMYPAKPLPDSAKMKIFGTTISLKKFIPIAIVITAMSMAMAWIHFKAVGVNFSDVDEISKKRFVKTDTGSAASLGYQVVIMGLVEPVYYLLLVYIIQKRKKIFSFLGAFTLFLGILNILYPFITSSRTGALYVLINSALVLYYTRGGIKWKTFLQIFMVASVLFVGMTILRHLANKVDTSNSTENPFAILIESTNFLGVDKTSQIVEGVPERMPFQFGTTLFLWVLAPIPRTIWTSKPEISIGRVVGVEIYHFDDRITGIPPGFIGELYMNFGYLAVIVGMFIFGLTIKLFYNSLKKVRDQSYFGLVFYVMAFIPFALQFIGGDLSQMMINVITSLVPLYFILRFSENRNKRIHFNGSLN